ncbi:MAG: response regulator [Roseivirga sp.]|nr:response regulator [Roseivirga sp.]
MIHRLVNLGVTDSLKVEEAQLIRLTNVLALLPIPVYLFYIGYGYFFDQIFSSFLACSMIVLTFISLYQNALRRYGMAKLVLLWLNGFSLWITFHVFNIDYSVLTGFLPLIICYPFFFELKTEQKVFFISAGFTMFFIVSSFFLPRQVLYAITLTPDDAELSNFFHLVFSFLLTVFLAYALSRYTKITRNKLILAREEAEKYSKLQSEFLANMSHEIRTPLNGIIGSSHLLKSTRLTNEQEEYAETIGLSSQMLREIIDNVLDLTRLEANGLELEEKNFDLARTIKGVALMLKPTLGKKEVDLKVDIPEDCMKFVKGDQKRIKQVVSNLLGNAIKFTDSGEITLSLQCSKRSNSAYNFEIRVRDTGIGISTADQEKLFTRFYQVESSADRRFMGTGLGLVICKSLVELMGGTLSVKSEVGKGTEFRIVLTLAVADKPVTAKLEEAISDKEQPDLSILVAEDNEVNQVVMRRMLSKLGYKMDLAEDGEEAFEMATSEAYDLIFMDVQMPGKDGMEATREIRRASKSLDKPLIVALTANAMADDKDRCLKAGMNDYLSKPVSAKEIQHILERWF